MHRSNCTNTMAERNAAFGKRPLRTALALLLAAALAIPLTGCAGKESPEPTASSAAAQTEAPQVSQTEAPAQPTAPAVPLDETVEPGVLFDQDGIRISVTGFTSSDGGMELPLLVENTTEQNLTVLCNEFQVNGMVLESRLYVEVPAGQEVSGAIILTPDMLDPLGITELATLDSIDAYAFNSDTYETTMHISLSVRSSIADTYVQPAKEDGVVLYEEDGVTVIYQCLDEDMFGQFVRLLVRNNSGQDLHVESAKTYVNGLYISPGMYSVLLDGTDQICQISLHKNEMEEHGIETVETVAFTLNFIETSNLEIIRQVSLEVTP